ncbi:hypothetical protein OIDMADRAFT_134483 [Oidiodendron maius Zn]|uniref:Uncharacterized protein n=1 Tax=Oidiodendron maius (strain Zn) TaxID=913774 RepID=A0A0C3D0J5_OIDMZ|nr:hypothetical protein OIDMADRAFT_134483 [Oidiodendron maius Zn]
MYCKRAQHSLINTPYSFIYQGKTQVREPGPAVQFWLAIKHGIYLCKKSKLEHGAEALREAYMLAQASCALGIRALDSIRELLTTLSPVNTSVWPDVRIQMLNLLHELMTSDLGSENTLTRITYQLLHDGGDRNVSENALLCLINECTRLLGQQHVATVRARLSLVKLLRRSHDYYRAACEDVELLSFCVEQTSSDSVWSRECARMLTHVFMALGHRDQAIDLEKDIVGMRISSTGTIDVMHHDECAIYTMEDLAENYDEKGDFEACATWLKLAVQNAQNLWTNQWMATQHLVEKLERALKACGKAEEIHIWKNKYARPSD